MKLSKIVQSVFFLVTLSTAVNAQIKVDVNIGTPPVWGPAVTTEQYYFLPDIETYYDIRTSQYVYLNNGSWIRSRNVPARYRNYNFNTGQVIVLNDYRGRSPYVYFKNHKVKYMKSNKGNWKKGYDDNGNHGKHGGHGNGKNKNK